MKRLLASSALSLMLLVSILAVSATAASGVTITGAAPTATTASITIDGSPPAGGDCQLQLRSGLTEADKTSTPEQTVSCSDWTGGPRSYEFSGLLPSSFYTALLLVSSPEGDAYYYRSFETAAAASPAEPSPPTSSEPEAPSQKGSAGAVGQRLSVKMVVSCSPTRKTAARSCPLRSQPTAWIRSNVERPYKLCIEFPVKEDATGEYADHRRGCSSKRQLTTGKTTKINLRKAVPSAFRTRPNFMFTWAIYKIEVSMPGKGAVAVKTIKFYR
jgi:hypothetical protein